MHPIPPSDRRFGWFVVCVLALVAMYLWWHGHGAAAAGTGAAAVAFVLVTLRVPGWLAPLNSAWFKLGLLLGRLVNPLVLGVIFFGLITPVAVIGRLLGRDALRLRRRNATTYWVTRGSSPQRDSFRNQF